VVRGREVVVVARRSQKGDHGKRGTKEEEDSFVIVSGEERELGDGFVGCIEGGSGIQSRIKLYLERKKNNPRIGGRERREREKEGRSDRTGKVRGGKSRYRTASKEYTV
jgi:hypothetical protein